MSNSITVSILKQCNNQPVVSHTMFVKNVRGIGKKCLTLHEVTETMK